MGKITEIKAQKNKNRANIYLDGEFVCGLEIATILKHSIKPGYEITEAELLSLGYESDVEKATEKALTLLDRQLYTKKQLRDKLLGKEYSKEVITEVIEKLERLGFISDFNYSKSFISSTNCKSIKEIEAKLLSKGINKQDVEKALAEVDVDEFAVCERLAEKFMRFKEPTSDIKTKLFAYLYRKGFSMSDIEKVSLKWF